MSAVPGIDRVLLVGNFFPDGAGAHGVCAELASQLRLEGVSVFETSSVRARWPRLLDMLGTVWRRRADFDVAHIDVYSGWAFGLAEAVAQAVRLAKRPYVLTLHGGGLPEFARRWPVRVQRLLRSAAAVTAPSEYLRRQMTPYRADIRVIPNPLRTTDYTFRLRAHPRPELVWVRAFHDIYNPSMAVRALARVARANDDARLTMVGPEKGDGVMAAVRGTADAQGVRDRVEFPGGMPRAQVRGFLNRGDIFLNTSRVDNTPVSLLEALASGLPIVTTDVGGIPDLVTDGYNARLVASDDAAAMADAVIEIVETPSLAKSLSLNARNTAVQFDWIHVLPQWRRLFGLVAGTRVSRPRVAGFSVQ